jgi:hypothetical protein
MSDNDNIYHICTARGKRSSLKMPGKIDKNELMKHNANKKRNSVSFKFGENNFKELRARFENVEPKKKNDEKNNKFIEDRKKSIKNEFSLVKELLKNKEIEVINENDEVKENTNKNVHVGKDYVDSDSESQKSENSNNEKE